MDTFVNPLRTVGNLVSSVPGNLVDGVVKVSGGLKTIPGNMLDGMGKVLNVRQVCEININKGPVRMVNL